MSLTCERSAARHSFMLKSMSGTSSGQEHKSMQWLGMPQIPKPTVFCVWERMVTSVSLKLFQCISTKIPAPAFSTITVTTLCLPHHSPAGAVSSLLTTSHLTHASQSEDVTESGQTGASATQEPTTEVDHTNPAALGSGDSDHEMGGEEGEEGGAAGNEEASVAGYNATGGNSASEDQSMKKLPQTQYLNHKSQWCLKYSQRMLIWLRTFHLIAIREGTGIHRLSGAGSTGPDCTLWRV
jgi:hypothetical protein